MASTAKHLPANVPGDFFVDSTCINCETCRWIAPNVFKEKDDASYVFQQPQTPEDNQRALMALISCPTASIGSSEKQSAKSAIAAYPDRIVENVYHCGFHHQDSFGATSYLIVRPEGNIMVDSPRFAAPLVKNIEKLGGVKYLFLTHQDDVADHDKFMRHFHCERIIHADDVRTSTMSVEHKLTGTQSIRWDNEMTFIPVPGHTKGSMCLLYKNKFLFTGDHMAWDPDTEELYAFRGACWYSWTELQKSMRTLLEFDFEWVLPGHSWRCHYTLPEMKEKMRICIERTFST